jgi:hypothetical protein
MLGLLVLAAAGATTFELLRGGSSQPTVAQLAEHNYRTLSARESRVLVRYARREYACLATKSDGISAPVPSRIRITITAPGKSARALAGLELDCDSAVGPPPPGAALQARDGLVLVYLPKGCILDPTQLTEST